MVLLNVFIGVVALFCIIDPFISCTQTVNVYRTNSIDPQQEVPQGCAPIYGGTPQVIDVPTRTAVWYFSFNLDDYTSSFFILSATLEGSIGTVDNYYTDSFAVYHVPGPIPEYGTRCDAKPHDSSPIGEMRANANGESFSFPIPDFATYLAASPTINFVIVPESQAWISFNDAFLSLQVEPVNVSAVGRYEIALIPSGCFGGLGVGIVIDDTRLTDVLYWSFNLTDYPPSSVFSATFIGSILAAEKYLNFSVYHVPGPFPPPITADCDFPHDPNPIIELYAQDGSYSFSVPAIATYLDASPIVNFAFTADSAGSVEFGGAILSLQQQVIQTVNVSAVGSYEIGLLPSSCRGDFFTGIVVDDSTETDALYWSFNLTAYPPSSVLSATFIGSVGVTAEEKYLNFSVYHVPGPFRVVEKGYEQSTTTECSHPLDPNPIIELYAQLGSFSFSVPAIATYLDASPIVNFALISDSAGRVEFGGAILSLQQKLVWTASPTASPPA